MIVACWCVITLATELYMIQLSLKYLHICKFNTKHDLLLQARLKTHFTENIKI